jgi:hypothetical protein
MLSPYALPLHTLRLWGRCLLPLVIWYGVGQLARFGLLVAGSELSHGSWREWRLAGVMFLFVIMVMLAMVVTVGMLHSLRSALLEMRARGREGAEESEPFFTGLGRAIVVFAGVYVAWGWYVDDARQFADADMERYAEQYDKYFATQLTNSLAGLDGKSASTLTKPVPPDAGTNLIMDFKIALIFMAIAFVLRYVAATAYDRRGGRGLALGVAFCELAFTFYGVAVVVQSTNSSTSWMGNRAVSHWWNDLWTGLAGRIPGWDGFWGLLDDVRPHFFDAIVHPLTMLTLTILVFGAYSDDARELIKGTRLEQATEFVEDRTHTLTRRGLGKLIVRMGWDKWPPLLNALRLTVRGGAPLFAVMCLCYVLLSVGADYVERGAYYFIGTAHRQLEWELYQIPVRFGVGMLFTTLTLCLFAATFDLSATRQRLNSRVSSGPSV